MSKLIKIELKKSEINLLIELLNHQYESCEYWGNKEQFNRNLSGARRKLESSLFNPSGTIQFGNVK